MAKLFLIPTSLNPEINSAVLLPNELAQIKHLEHFIVETAKIGRLHLKQLNLDTPLQQLQIEELNKHKQDISKLIEPFKSGKDIGLLSDCGCPAVADPGSRIVAVCHEMGIEVVPLVGPSSILLTLMASGLNGQKFTFHGYLPAEPDARKVKLKQLEQSILKENSTHVFIEAPFRNQKLFEAMLTTLHAEIKLCLGVNLMTSEQKIITREIGKWRNSKFDFNKQEIIFLIGK